MPDTEPRDRLEEPRTSAKDRDGIQLEDAPEGRHPTCPACGKTLDRPWIKKKGLGMLEQKQILMRPVCDALPGHGVFEQRWNRRPEPGEEVLVKSMPWNRSARSVAVALIALSCVLPWWSPPSGGSAAAVGGWSLMRGDPTIGLVVAISLVIAALSGSRLRGPWRTALQVVAPLLLFYSVAVVVTVVSMGGSEPLPWPLSLVLPTVAVCGTLAAGGWALLLADGLLLAVWVAAVRDRLRQSSDRKTRVRG